MKLYWIKAAEVVADDPFSGFGYGITAYDQADAIGLLAEYFRHAGSQIDVEAVFTVVSRINDLADIEQNHVRPNMGNHMRRGIWFPLGLNFDPRGF